MVTIKKTGLYSGLERFNFSPEMIAQFELGDMALEAIMSNATTKILISVNPPATAEGNRFVIDLV